MKRPYEESINDLGEEIALKCYNDFDKLSSRGKPSSNEWTHLAVFLSINENNSIEILSIGTGTKCLGGDVKERGTQGCLLHDSHAEIIARRSLLRLFYEEILNEKNSILIKNDHNNKYSLNKSIRLYMFVSSPPCGAAAHLSDPIKRPKFEHKILNSNGKEELYLKPGKGFSTTSLSCTNKINRWIYQGLEGTLLSQFINEPIKLTGLFIKTDKDLLSIFPNVDIQMITKQFEYGPSNERIRPCPMSIAWWKYLDYSSTVITVDGYSLGLIKKFHHKQEYASPLAKCVLFKLYLEIIKKHSSPNPITYADAKSLSSNSLRTEFMLNNPHWIKTDPNIFYSFTCHSDLN